jgi:thermitase
MLLWTGLSCFIPLKATALTSDSADKEKIFSPAGNGGIKEYVNDEIIVKFRSSDNFKKQVSNLATEKNLEKKDLLSKSNIASFKIKDKKKVEEKINELRNEEDVLYVQPNYKYQQLAPHIPLDADFANQWGLNNSGQAVNNKPAGTSGADIDAPEGWEISEGTEHAAIVAVIDSGVSYNHPDLLGNMWDGSSCVDENNATIVGGCIHGYDYNSEGADDNNPLPSDSSHGTHVAGIIGAKEDGAGAGTGIVGVAPNVKIMALKVTNLYTDEIVKAIAFAENNGAKVINASWGGYADDDVLYEAIENFDGLFAAAAGNDGFDNDDGLGALNPCGFDLDNVVCVAATDQNDGLADFSNYGTTSVDIGAPGTDIYSSVGYGPVGSEDFDSASVPAVPAGWSATGNFGTVDLGGGDIALVGDTNQSPYMDNALNTVISPAYDLGTAVSAEVSFTTTCDTEYDLVDYTDYMQLDFSTDGGGTWDNDYVKWDEVVIDSDTNPAGSATYNMDLPIDVDSGISNFKVRFEWYSNGTDNNYAGCTINNFSVKTLGDGANGGFEYWDGTSMATPFVSGLAGLAWGYRGTNLSTAAVKDAIVNYGDTISSLDSKTVSGKRISAYGTLDYLESSKDMINVSFSDSPNVGGGISRTEHTADLGVPYGTDVTSLIPVIDHNGKSISPASGVAQDFTSPVTYTITAADDSTQEWTLSAIVQLNSAKQITSFGISGISSASTEINETNHTIAVAVPYGTNVTSLIPVIVHTGASVSPLSGVAQDFTSPVTYTVTAENSSIQAYVVTVTPRENPFISTKVSFGSDVSSGETDQTEVKLKFKNIGDATQYMVSRHEDFSGAEWKSIKSGVKVKIKKESKKQKFYVKFKNADGIESAVFKKTVRYVSQSSTIKNSAHIVHKGDTLIQSGKNFKKDSKVNLYFSKPDGGYYPKVIVSTDSKGSFSVSYKVNKPAGTYTWYAVNASSGKKSEKAKYIIK